jgi:predicted nucleic acid-binding protein
MVQTKKLKLYLDTSIPSAYYNNSQPARQKITQRWFENEATNYELYTSNIAFEEIQQLKNEQKKTNIENLIFNYNIHLLTHNDKSQQLAEEYLDKGAIPKSEPFDAYHVAIAVLNGMDAIASWNFSHLVSINPIRKIHEINKKHKFNIIEIGSLQIFGGEKYGTI